MWKSVFGAALPFLLPDVLRPTLTALVGVPAQNICAMWLRSFSNPVLPDLDNASVGNKIFSAGALLRIYKSENRSRSSSLALFQRYRLTLPALWRKKGKEHEFV